MPTDLSTPSFAPLSVEALEQFADMRAFVASLADNLLSGDCLTQSEHDLPTLQALVEHQAMKHANYGTWVALGIAFGDVLVASVPGLAWRLVTDQSGTYAGLQFHAKALSISAPTMLWKRIERGEEMDLAHMASELKTFIEDHGHEYRDA